MAHIKSVSQTISESIRIDEKVHFNLDESELVEKITGAIKNRYYLGFYYEEEEDSDIKSGFRFVEAYTLGKGFRRGTKVSHPDRHYLRGYLIRDTKKDENKKLSKFSRKSKSKSGFSKNVGRWRLFRLNRMSSIEVFRMKIPKAQDGYNPEDSMMGSIIETAKF